MRYSLSQFLQLMRVVLVALPVLLLLGLNGRMVSLLRPALPAGAPTSAAPRATVVKQKVRLEAAAPADSYAAPAFGAGLAAPYPPRQLAAAPGAPRRGAGGGGRASRICGAAVPPAAAAGGFVAAGSVAGGRLLVFFLGKNR